MRRLVILLFLCLTCAGCGFGKASEISSTQRTEKAFAIINEFHEYYNSGQYKDNEKNKSELVNLEQTNKRLGKFVRFITPPQKENENKMMVKIVALSEYEKAKRVNEEFTVVIPQSGSSYPRVASFSAMKEEEKLQVKNTVSKVQGQIRSKKIKEICSSNKLLDSASMKKCESTYSYLLDEAGDWKTENNQQIYQNQETIRVVAISDYLNKKIAETYLFKLSPQGEVNLLAVNLLEMYKLQN